MEHATEFLTGYSESEFKRLGYDESLRCCYRCKRTEKDRSAVIIDKRVLYQGLKLLPLSVRFKDEEMVMIAKFLICVECYILLEARRDENARHFPMEIYERGDFI